MMRVVYSLREALERDPEHVRAAQALSLDKSRPEMGLSPRLGLYGSDEWWRNVANGKIKRARYAGVISGLYFAGMDGDRTKPNSFRMKPDEGSTAFDWSMVANDPSDKSLYTVGRRIEVTTVFVELKKRKSFWARELHERPLEISIQRRAPKVSGES